MFQTLKEAQDWIENAHRFGEKLDLHRMHLACRKLGNPQTKFKSIHVAGTNGKGSTANYIKNILFDAKYKCGIYTSPYVVKFNERIGIDQYFISDADIVTYANRLQDLWDEIYAESGEQTTFFEILTLMAFLYFADSEVDYAVIEVGLGGTLDATNVIMPEVACITNISYDHMKQLGNTLESIALNKLGIVKPGIPLISTIEDKSLFPLFYEVTAKHGSHLKIVDLTQISDVKIGETTTFAYRQELYALQLPGLHQVKNACLAIEVIRSLRVSNSLRITEENIKNGLKITTWPGRFEIFNSQIILDGAHNIGGIESLKQTLGAMYSGKKIKCLFCMMKDKEHEKIIAELDNIVDEFHFTEIDYPRRANAIDLYNESHHPNKHVHTDFKAIFKALERLLKVDEVLLVTGSLYFISEVRKLMVNEERQE
ncbi:MAG: bifunctional folylpolyglutamate synthase/dihydrofolate synthase [Bacilli bacterium]|nr:bifunctional folylpolyglutamate synthase/dihydrofolate synthase [Bacilli bacterium]MBN2696275.1 bifunctional folylpolyglutamate synthase/dihydrofolate synthase [Bacilli bacterium]